MFILEPSRSFERDVVSPPFAVVGLPLTKRSTTPFAPLAEKPPFAGVRLPRAVFGGKSPPVLFRRSLLSALLELYAAVAL